MTYSPGITAQSFIRTICFAVLFFLFANQFPTFAAKPQEVEFRSPEAWAMKYFASALIFSGIQLPRAFPAGYFSFGGEVTGIPNLSTRQQRVGFSGSKHEDLNKAPLLLRPRVQIGLPLEILFSVSYIPPVEVFDLKPHFLGAALEYPLDLPGAWNLGFRAHGHYGTFEGSVTCSEDVVAHAPGSEQNPYGCQEVSNDRLISRYAGMQVLIGYLRHSVPRISPYGSIGIGYAFPRFRVDALLSRGFRDNSVLETEGTLGFLSTGLDIRVLRKLGVNAELFYAPLMIERGGDETELDGFFTVRGVVRYDFFR